MGDDERQTAAARGKRAQAGRRVDETPADEATVDEVIPRERDEAQRAGEPPVVARLIVEIRSDGSRTIARGAMEDMATGQKVAIEARGDSPLRLALSLARAISAGPSFARTAARALLPGRRKRR